MFALKILAAKQEHDKNFRKPATKMILSSKDYVRLAKSMASELGFDYETTSDEEIMANHYLKEYLGMKVVCRFGKEDGFTFE